MKQHYGVFLTDNTPLAISTMLKKYVREADGLSYVVAFDVEPNSYFLQMTAISVDEAQTLKIQIPLQYVVAIAEAFEDQRSIGFLAAVEIKGSNV